MLVGVVWWWVAGIVAVLVLAEQLRDALGGPTPQNTGFIIGAATATYCPENLPKLKTS